MELVPGLEDRYLPARRMSRQQFLRGAWAPVT